jgi:hypothetical protein
MNRPVAGADVVTSSKVAELVHMPQSTVEDWARRGVIPSPRSAVAGSTFAAESRSSLLDEEPQTV